MELDLANTVIEMDVTVLAFLAGTVIPLLTALVTKITASSAVKAVANLILSMAAGGVAFLVANDGTGTLLELIAAMVSVYLASGVSYTNFWKPTGTAAAVQSATPNTGVGGSKG